MVAQSSQKAQKQKFPGFYKGYAQNEHTITSAEFCWSKWVKGPAQTVYKSTIQRHEYREAWFIKVHLRRLAWPPDFFFF